MLGEEFLDLIPNAQSIKRKIHKLDLHQNKNFCSVQDPEKRMKKLATEWGKIFANQISDEDLVSRIYKELSKFNSKMQIIQLKMSKDFSPKRIYRW